MALSNGVGRPIKLVNWYLPVGNPRAVIDMGREIMETLSEHPRPTIILGDWNTTPDEELPTWMEMTGCRIVDREDFGNWEPARIARNNKKGRQVDFMAANATIAVAEREQRPGLSDHDLIYYDLVMDQEMEV